MFPPILFGPILNDSPLQTTPLIAAITGFGSTFTTKTKLAPTQPVALGVTT